MREKELYRSNLTDITERFKVSLIPIRQAAEYCGIDHRTLSKVVEVKKIGSRYYVSAAVLARYLS